MRRKLSNGIDMPVLGLGTWQLTGQECVDTVKDALDMGYNHIDTAEIYGNQKEIGRAIKDVDRKDIFITSKVWRDNLHHDDVLRACDKTLEDLGTDYLDLYLIHWPNLSIPLAQTAKAMKRLLDDGKIRAFGVSNFTIDLLEQVEEASAIPVTMNQVEFHPFLYQKELLDYCKKNNIQVTAYSPLARGMVMKNDVMQKIADNHEKTPAQISLRWLVQKGLVVIPKSSSTRHLKENMEIFDFELNNEEMERIDHFDDMRLVSPGFAPF